MPSPGAYIAKIRAIVGDQNTAGPITVTIAWSSSDEAKAALPRVRSMQAQMQQLKQMLAADPSASGSSVTAEQTSLGKTIGTSIAAGLMGRQSVGMINAAKRLGLGLQRATSPNPYDRVTRLTDAMIETLDKLAARIEASPQYQSASSA